MSSPRSKCRLHRRGQTGPLPRQPILEERVVRYRAKRAFDLALSALGLLLSAPLWLLIALAVKIADGGPVFYSQERVGGHNRAFLALKFRTMMSQAETAGPALAQANDPRVTRIGHLLRATALDELPQLFNILLGHMSFVGPRPERPEFVTLYRQKVPTYERRLLATPGLTGLAQVYGHYDSSPRQKLRYDLLYLKKQSLWLDLKLIVLSFWITFLGRWQVRGRKL